jgi:short-subunit dehydrogenase
METLFFGTLSVTRAFAPQLGAHESSAIMNVLSGASWISFTEFGAYCAAKSAAWSMTNTLRLELAPRGTQVSALHVDFMATDMIRDFDVPAGMTVYDPADVARITLDGLAAGLPEIIVGDVTKMVRAGLSGGVAALYPQFA